MSSADGWGEPPLRHRSFHRGRVLAGPSGPAVAPSPAERGVAPADIDDRSVRQRLSDALPMTSVAGICFALGLSLRAGGSPGPAPALPIWTLFLALGCIAALGAGASWVVGGSAATSVVSEARPARSRRPAPRSERSGVTVAATMPRAAAETLGDPADDTLPGVADDAELPVMPRRPARRSPVRAEPDDPMPEFPEAAPLDATTPRQVIEEIDRLATDLRPSPSRARPAG